jgi:Dolichyl-phosphate-mannose-protein mannosyltransferase
VRLWPDVEVKPLYEDEAISGLISMRPLPEVLDTVVLDRGGAPLHFVLAHLAFAIDASPAALRWMSVLFAVAAVPLSFDLGRRLGGLPAGILAAAVMASSTALSVYGTFGRMYALFVFVAALFADLYVRALDRRTLGAVAAAAAASVLLPAVHPYGAIPAFVAFVAAAILWRRRSLAPAVAVAIAAAAAIPLVLADLRLADRAAVGAGGSHPLATPGEAWSELVAALSAFAGGDGLPFLFFTLVALLGVAVLLRERPAVAALALATMIPPLLFVVVRTSSAPDLSPRHLFYGLPLWAAAIGVGGVRLTRRLQPAVSLAALAVLVVAVAASPPSALRDPRELGFASVPQGEHHVIRAGSHDVLMPYSAVFLKELPDVRSAVALPHAPGDEILRALDHADEPIGDVYLAIPTSPWTIRRLRGPFDRAGALEAVARTLAETPHSEALDRWFAWIEPGLCEALRKLGRPCP